VPSKEQVEDYVLLVIILFICTCIFFALHFSRTSTEIKGVTHVDDTIYNKIKENKQSDFLREMDAV
jgi:hypothetical protein